MVNRNGNFIKRCGYLGYRNCTIATDRWTDRQKILKREFRHTNKNFRGTHIHTLTVQRNSPHPRTLNMVKKIPRQFGQWNPLDTYLFEHAIGFKSIPWAFFEKKQFEKFKFLF